METDNSRDQTEAKAIAGRRAASLQPIEALENMLNLVWGNTRSVVGNRQDCATILQLDADDHHTTVTTVFNGVVDEIRYSIEQEVAISANTYGLVTDYLDASTFALGGCVK
jgi:hypothetical protein